jgi:hypothetical protein
MEHCTLFVLGSQYVLLAERVLAYFNPLWPNLNFAVASFVAKPTIEIDQGHGPVNAL